LAAALAAAVTLMALIGRVRSHYRRVAWMFLAAVGVFGLLGVARLRQDCFVHRTTAG
jgi:hypothetical protein